MAFVGDHLSIFCEIQAMVHSGRNTVIYIPDQ